MRGAAIAMTFALAALRVLGQVTPAMEFTNFSGVWGETIHEDNYERNGGPPLGDYQGIPLNDAGRMKADSHDHSEWSIPEFQCRPHSAPYQWRALGSVRFWEEIDPIGRDLTAIHIEYLRSLDRVIWMDGRPQPPDYAPYSWSGFSTGEFVGNTLKVTTTHIKASYLRRNGAAFSEKATMTEFIDRHGDILTVTMILTDPVYLEEPFIQTTNYVKNDHTQLTYYPCTVSEENISTAFPHFLPGTTEQLKDAAGWIPPEAARGGSETLYPDYRKKLAGLGANQKAGEAGSPAPGTVLNQTLNGLGNPAAAPNPNGAAAPATPTEK